MNNKQKHISKMTKADLIYRSCLNSTPASFYKIRKKLKDWSKEYKEWEDFKRISRCIRD
jgi:hypothetical protein